MERGDPVRRGCKMAAVAAALTGLAAAGCCTPVILAGRYFDALDPFTAVNGFVYAVETGQYDFAYDLMSEDSKAALSRTKFKLGLMFNYKSDEVKIPIRDLILGAERYRFEVRQSDYNRATMVVWYRLPNGNAILPTLYLVLESEEEMKAAGRKRPIWRIAFEKTLRELAGVDFSQVTGEK